MENIPLPTSDNLAEHGKANAKALGIWTHVINTLDPMHVLIWHMVNLYERIDALEKEVKELKSQSK